MCEDNPATISRAPAHSKHPDEYFILSPSNSLVGRKYRCLVGNGHFLFFSSVAAAVAEVEAVTCSSTIVRDVRDVENNVLAEALHRKSNGIW